MRNLKLATFPRKFGLIRYGAIRDICGQFTADTWQHTCYYQTDYLLAPRTLLLIEHALSSFP